MGLGEETLFINSYEVANYVKINTKKNKKKSQVKPFNVQTYLP